MPEQILYTQNKLFLKVLFDQCLHCTSFIQEVLDTYQIVKWAFSNLRKGTVRKHGQNI